MRTITPLLLLLLAAPASADVYRWINPDGSISFSDRPQPGAETVDTSVSKSTHQEPASGTDTASTQERITPTNPDDFNDAFLGLYDAFEIISPDDDATFRGTDVEVQVGLILSPALQPDHTIRALVDGQEVKGDFPKTQFVLSNIFLGTHQLKVQIIDEVGNIQAQTPTVRFHVRKPLPPGALPQAPEDTTEDEFGIGEDAYDSDPSAADTPY